MDRGRNREPDPGANPDAGAHAAEADARDHGEGLTAPGVMHGIG